MIYHYGCLNCKHEFEIVQSIKDKRKRKCPSCNKLKLERILYPAYGRVARRADQMANLDQLAKFNTDKLSKWEKESKDEEYKNSSRLAKHKLEQQKYDDPLKGFPIEKIKKATPAQKKKYIETGEI